MLLIDPSSRVLLVQYLGRDRYWWIAPGGGVAGGESFEAAARREVREETGLASFALGPWVWRREHDFRWNGRWWRQEERFFLARVPAFAPVRAGFTEDELRVLGEHRWWRVGDIERSDEPFAPRRLGGLLRELLEQGPPSEPLEVGT